MKASKWQPVILVRSLKGRAEPDDLKALAKVSGRKFDNTYP